MRDYCEIGIDKVHAKISNPFMAVNFDLDRSGWNNQSQTATATKDSKGRKQLMATGMTYNGKNNSVYAHYNVLMNCIHLQFNPTTIDSNKDFALRCDFNYIIPKIQEELYTAGLINVEEITKATLMRLDPAADRSSIYSTEQFIDPLEKYSNYKRGQPDKIYPHGITSGTQSHQFGTYNRSLHLTTNKGIDAGIIPPNVTRNELRLFNKGSRTWTKKNSLYTINDLFDLDQERIIDIRKDYFKMIRLQTPNDKQPIKSHEKMLKNYQEKYGVNGFRYWSQDKAQFELVALHGITKAVEICVLDSIRAKGSNNYSQAKIHRRKQVEAAISRYDKLTAYEVTARELINEFQRMFA